MRTYYITQGTLLNALWWPAWKLRMLWGQKYLTENRYLTEGCTEHSFSLKTVKVKERGSRRGRESRSLSVLSRVWLSVSPWTVARPAPLSMRFPRQEYWSALPFPPPPGNHPNPGIEPKSPASPTLAGRFFTTLPPGKHCDEHPGFTEYSFSFRTITIQERVRRRKGSRSLRRNI